MKPIRQNQPGAETPELEAAGNSSALDPAQARSLMRKLRDLNLTACTLEVGGGERVSIDGCLSIDRPVEGELRYLLRDGEGTERVLGIRLGESCLHLTLASRVDGGEPRGRDVALHSDGEGRAMVPELLARMDPESSDCREVEHFLRRLVRGVYAA
jgi:hypothetical protein